VCEEMTLASVAYKLWQSGTIGRQRAVSSVWLEPWYRMRDGQCQTSSPMIKTLLETLRPSSHFMLTYSPAISTNITL